MSRINLLFSLSLLPFLGADLVFAESSEAGDMAISLSFSLANWKDDKAAAFILYSDDSMVRSIKSRWTVEQPDVPYDGFYTLGRKYNIPMTFFVVPRLMDEAAEGDTSHVYFSSLHPPSIHPGAGGSWADWKFMHDQGHEIGSHLYSHTNFRPGPDGKPQSSVDPHEECAKAVESIKREIGEAPLSINFAYGRPTDPVLEVARRYTPLTEEDFSDDTANIRKAGFGDATSADDLIGEMKQALQEGKCLILGGHGIRTELGRQEEAHPDFKQTGIRWDGYRPIEYADLEGLFQYLDQNREEITIDVFKNVSRYLAQRKASVITVLSREDGKFLLEVTHDLDPDLFTVPLTLRIEPEGPVAKLSLRQNGKSITVKKRGLHYLADVVPNGGPIEVLTHR